MNAGLRPLMNADFHICLLKQPGVAPKPHAFAFYIIKICGNLRGEAAAFISG
jgi:hypothetical protein